MAMTATDPLTETGPGAAALRMRGIGKAFSGVTVLRDVGFDLRPGETHVLAGENGAGKSTLIKILAGVHTEYEGTIELAGRAVRWRSPQEAARAGIAVIHQEMSLIPAMSVSDNIFLGRELGGAFVSRKAQRERTGRLLAQLGLALDLERAVEEYPLSVRQMIEIAKALAFEARLIVMDEPTSALTEPEVERLFAVIADLKARGCGIIYISHKMEEIYRVADRITVLRDGRHVATTAAAELPRAELVRQIVGRELSDQFPERAGVNAAGSASDGAPRLRVKGLRVPDPQGTPRPAVDGASFEVAPGEILGLAGLQGSGASELLNGLFGAYGRLPRGEVELDGRAVRIESPGDAIRQGLALLTCDRKSTGLIPTASVADNVTLAALPRLSPGMWLNRRRELEAAERHRAALRIRAATLGQEITTLSGGNQQKALLARWLETRPRVLLLDDPTRGVDIGAKHEIYELMNQWTAQGMAIVLVSSELPELLALSDRILVFHRGRITARLARGEATQEKILHAAMGGGE